MALWLIGMLFTMGILWSDSDQKSASWSDGAWFGLMCLIWPLALGVIVGTLVRPDKDEISYDRTKSKS